MQLFLIYWLGTIQIKKKVNKVLENLLFKIMLLSFKIEPLTCSGARGVYLYFLYIFTSFIIHTYLFTHTHIHIYIFMFY